MAAMGKEPGFGFEKEIEIKGLLRERSDLSALYYIKDKYFSGVYTQYDFLMSNKEGGN